MENGDVRQLRRSSPGFPNGQHDAELHSEGKLFPFFVGVNQVTINNQDVPHFFDWFRDLPK